LNKEKAVCPKCGADQADNPSRLILSRQKPKVKEEEPDEIDDGMDFDEDGGNMGIESFEQLEEAANEDEEDGYA
jgi:hypothetical protein